MLVRQHKTPQQHADRARITLAADPGHGARETAATLQVSRTAFLSDPTHRIVVRFTPKHTSWLNQIEVWFSILGRKVLRRGNFSSVKDLEKRISDFIDFFNRTVAKPFRWTYAGKPVAAGMKTASKLSLRTTS